MKKKTLIVWVDVGLFVLLAATILTAIFDVFTHSFMHVFLGILTCAAALLHLGLHWEWIKNATARFGQQPDIVRTNAKIDLALFLVYSFCGVMGLTARLMFFIFPLHVHLGVVHVVLAVAALLLQVLHIARHWKWVTVQFHRTP